MEPFDRKMTAYDRREKPYIVQGPQMLRQDLQRTQCSLFLEVNDDDKVTAFRAGQDPYNLSYNFSDLPEIPSTAHDDRGMPLSMGKPNNYDTILASMAYDEPLQMALLKSKRSKVFSNDI